jgi:uncharacterized membrane protein
MAALPVRKIAVAGVLSAVMIVLGITRLGFIPWFSGASITIMQVPVIIGAILEGPVVGTFIGLLFGVFSLIQAAVTPTGVDAAFVNPLISVLPRLFIGIVTYGVYRALQGGITKKIALETLAILVSSVAGSLTNTVLVLSALGILGFYPWQVIWTVAIGNGPLEAVASAILTLAVVGAYTGIDRARGRSKLSKEEQ